MNHILVTGASGFIGKNLIANLKLDNNNSILEYDKSNNASDLDAFIKKADFIYHLAGVNRPRSESEFSTGNRDLTERIVSLLEKYNSKAKILFTSSIQAEQDNAYGLSKKAAEQAVAGWAEKTNNTAYIYRLPNAFGKWSKPNYNSVVATFCYNTANDIKIEVSDPTKQLELVYIDDIVEEFTSKLNSMETTGFYQVKITHKITLSNLASTIHSFKEIPSKLLIPDFSDELTTKLYSTYTSFLNEQNFFYELEQKSDERGWLAEVIKSKCFGQIFVSTTKPGYTRGKHWHNSKIEKFLVLQGSAEIKLRDYNSTNIIIKKVAGDKPVVADMLAGSIHTITNIGTEDLLLLIWSNEIFNPDKPDTYFKEIDNE